MLENDFVVWLPLFFTYSSQTHQLRSVSIPPCVFTECFHETCSIENKIVMKTDIQTNILIYEKRADAKLYTE